MSNKLKVGIVGCGFIAKKRHIPRFMELKNEVDVRAVCDRNESFAQQTAAEYGISGIYHDFTEMLSREDLDLIDICTPPQMHAPLALEGMEHGSHILMEKPMALRVSDCDQMINVSRDNGVKLCIIHNMLFFPPLLKAKKLVAQGAIGDFIGMRIFISDPSDNALLKKEDWAHTLPGGVLEESVSHPVYLSLAFLDRVENVDIWAKNFLEHPWAPFDEFRIELEGEKAISSIVKSYASNSWAAYIDILGTEGVLHLDLHSMLLIYHKRKTSLKPLPLARYSLSDASQIVRGVAANAFKVMTGRAKLGQDIIIERFVDSILNHSQPPVTGEEGREAIRVTEMITEKLYKKYGDSHLKYQKVEDQKK
ncbi:Gfo/Idh/MocA family protein [Chloroflexota bacterium]